jgi:hypothetical protein
MVSPRWLPLLALGCAAALSADDARGQGDDCPASIDDWQADHGALRAGLSCGTFIGTTDGWGGPFSRGEFRYRKALTLPYELEVTWRRLGSDGGESLSVIVPGGYLLLKRDAYGFYAFSDSAFQWRPLPGFRTHRESTVKVQQSAREIAVWVDGQPLDRIPFAAPSLGGTVGLGVKGASGYRSRMIFHGFAVRSLAPQGQAPSTSPVRPK